MFVGHLHDFFWRNVYLFLLPIFWLFFFFYLMLNCLSCLYILEINPLSIALFADIFFHSKSCIFVLLMVSFAIQKLLHWIRFHLSIFVFIFITVGDGTKKSCDLCQSVLPMFFSKGLIASGLILRSLILFEFIFCVWY